MLRTVSIEAVQPSCVHGAISGRFRKSTCTDLLVIRHNVLELYDVNTITGAHQFVSETRLNAPPISATALPSPVGVVAGRDRLVLLIDDIHVSVCSYSSATRSFIAESLFLLDDAVEIPLQSSSMVPPILRIDPLSRLILVISRRKYMFLIPVTFFSGGRAIDTARSGGGEVLQSREVVGVSGGADDEANWGDEEEDRDLPTEAAPASTIVPVKREEDNDDADEDSRDNSYVEFGPVRLVVIPTGIRSSLRNIRDAQFVPSTSDPTIAFLCEATPTWAGRVKLIEWRTGTVHSHELSCAVAWFSVDLQHRATSEATKPNASAREGFLFLGEVDSVPYNATSLVPFSSASDPSPAVLCLASNSILHITSKRVSGFFLNVHGKEEGANTTGSAWQKVAWVPPGPSKQQQQATRRSAAAARLNLNCAGAVVVPLPTDSDAKAFLIAAESGDVMRCTAQSDGRVVHGLTCEYLFGASPVSCAARIQSIAGSGVIFFGSAAGDSHSLLASDLVNGATQMPPAVFTLKCLGPVLDADVVDSTTLDTELIAAATAGWGQSSPSSPYEELLRDFKIAPTPSTSDGADINRSVLDLLLCSGRDNTGSLHICRQSVRPRVILEQALDSISVFYLETSGSKKRARMENSTVGADDGVGSSTSTLPTLLVATATSSIVVTMGMRMTQVRPDDTKLITKHRTIFATVTSEMMTSTSSVSNILQVTELGVVQLLSPDHRSVLARHDFPSTVTSTIRFATLDVITRHLLVLTSDNTLFALYIGPDNGFIKMKVSEEDITALTMLPTLLGSGHAHHFIALATTSGTLQLLEVLDNVYTVRGNISRFSTFPSNAKITIRVGGDAGEPAGATAAEPTLSAKVASEPLPVVTEILAARLSKSDAHIGSVEDSTVSLFCLSNGEIVVYAIAGSSSSSSAEANRPVTIKFTKTATCSVDADHKVEKVESIEEKQRRLLEQTRHTVQDTTTLFYSKCQHLMRFTDVAGLDGVFVCGKKPRMFITAGNRILSHPVQTGTIRGFSEINGPLIQNGFVVCGEGSLSFATIDPTFDYSMSWATKRIQLGGTPHNAVYSHAARSVFVAVSRRAPFRPRKAPFDLEMRVTWNEEGQSTAEVLPQVELQTVKETQGKPIPVVDRYSIMLVSAVDWTSSDQLELHENEQVLSSALVDINAAAVVRGEPMPETAQVCAVGTGYPLGEDTPCRGRLLILTTGIVSGARRIRILAQDETKGPVTALASMKAHVVAAVGATIKLYRVDWETNRLVVSAFLYAGVYVPRMTVVKNYLVFGDIVHSCCLARFCERELSLQRLAKHSAEFSVLALDVLYRDHAFGIVATDVDRRVVLLGYTPRQVSDYDASNMEGRVVESPLSVDAELRIPSGSITKTLRLTAPNGGYPVLMYLTNTGSIGFLASVSEYDNHTLNWISRKLVQELSHHAGLNPKAFLSCQSELATPNSVIAAKEKVADGALLNRFADLGWTQRAQIAMTAGTRASRVLNVLVGLQQDTNLF